MLPEIFKVKKESGQLKVGKNKGDPVQPGWKALGAKHGKLVALHNY